MTFKEMRINAGYTQLEFAKKIGISKRTIEQFEKDIYYIRNASFATIVKICYFFDISIDNFYFNIFGAFC